jgi:hypothetical protein
MTWARRALPDVLAAALVALAAYLWFGHAFLNYDTFYALVWGSDVFHGRVPEYDVPVAPTPHPLAMLVAGIASPFGDGAEGVLLGLVLLGLGALAVGLFRLGQALWAWPVGLLAAAIVLTRQPILNFGIRGYVDLPAVALVVWAAVLEARRLRRGAPVLVLLTLAGLLRPEAWLYALAYWLWVAPPLRWAARLRLLALAAAAPLLWALTDLLITGDPFHSLNGTSDLAAVLERPTGLDDVPEVLPRRLGEILRLPELIAAVIGFGAGLVWFRRRTLLPAAVAMVNGLAFLVFAVGGLPLLGRYLFLAASMLAAFGALAALGWTALPRAARARRPWRAGGLAILLVLAAYLAAHQSDRLETLRDDIAKRDEIADDLHSLVGSAAAERVLDRCGPIFVPNHRPVPNLAYWTGTPPEDVVSAQLERPPPEGVYIEPANERVKQLSILDPKDPKRLDAERPAGYRLVVANASWRLYARCPRG